MIGLEVTEEIKQKNRLNEAVGSILVRGSFPKKWNGVENVVGGYQFRTDLHASDGWKEVVQPVIETNQRRGAIFLDEANDVFTYEVIDLTEEEIQQNLIAQSQSQKNELVRQLQEKAIVKQAQNFDDTEALDNQALFPFWRDALENGTELSLGNKIQHPVGTEIWLFKVNQPTLVPDAQFPPNAPGTEALYSRVSYPNEVLPWEQPSGAQDAYGQDIDFGGTERVQVSHDNPNDGGNIWLYRSKIPDNVTEPGRDGTFDRWWAPIELIEEV